MEDFLNIFDTIYLINLDERTDRLTDFYNGLRKLGVSDEFITNKIKRFSAIKHVNGTDGCTESHITILRTVRDLGLNNVLVLEDDCEFIDEYLPYLNQVGEDITKKEWDIYYLGYNSHIKLDKVSNNSVKIKNCFSTHAIVYSKSVFDVIIEEYNNGVIKILDVHYRDKTQETYNCVGSLPILCTQSIGLSNIENKVVNYGFIVDRFKEHTKHLTW